jgi:hypothetical protein
MVLKDIDDIISSMDKDIRDYGLPLKDIDDIISSMDKDIRDYGLPELDDQDAEQGYHNREVRE